MGLAMRHMNPAKPKCCDNKSWSIMIEILGDREKRLGVALGRVICCPRDDISREPSVICHWLHWRTMHTHTSLHKLVASFSFGYTSLAQYIAS